MALVGLGGLGGLAMPGLGLGAAMTDWEDQAFSYPDLNQNLALLGQQYYAGLIDGLTYQARLDALMGTGRRRRRPRRRMLMFQSGMGSGAFDAMGGFAGLGGGWNVGGGMGMNWGGGVGAGWAGGLGGFAATPTPFQMLPGWYNSWY